MIWTAGRVVTEVPTIPVTDRTFEHGLGLFETLRTRSGRPVALAAHRARMLASAAVLGIPVDPAAWPTAADVARLLDAVGGSGDYRLRITATGGTTGRAASSVVWMTATPLAAEPRLRPIRVLLDDWATAGGDPMARHKALNYWSRRIAHERAMARGCGESIGGEVGSAGLLEGSRTSLFAVSRGNLITPGLDAPIVPGVTRARVLRLARALGLAVREVGAIDRATLIGAAEVFLTNAVRGVVPVGSATSALAPTNSNPTPTWLAPGPVTIRLAAALDAEIDP